MTQRRFLALLAVAVLLVGAYSIYVAGRSAPLETDKTPIATTTPPMPVPGDSGITGNVLLGPHCPVERDPPDPGCADTRYATALVVTTADGARVITTFTSNSDGAFTVKVPPGTYAIRSAAAANILPYCSSGEVVVVRGAYTQISVSCDTGIR